VFTWGDAQSEIILNLEAGKVQVAVREANGSQTIRFNNNRRTFLVDVIMCRIGIFKGLVLRSRNLIFCHKCFSKIF